jgi:hypothetical protein
MDIVQKHLLKVKNLGIFRKITYQKNEIYVTTHFYYRYIFESFKHRVNVASLAWYNNIDFNACFNDS